MVRKHRAPRARPAAASGSLDAAAIDALYGLEPVIEPSAGADGGEPRVFFTITCPFCGERFATAVDLSAGPAAYVEDCQVCCRPIELVLEGGEPDGRARLTARRGD